MPTNQPGIPDVETVLNNITDGFFILDKDFNFTYVNKAFEKLCHVNKDECIGTNYWKQFPKSVDQKFYTQYNYALEHNTSVSFEEYANSLDKWVVVNVYPVNNGLMVYFTDITERHKHEELIESQNKQLRTIAWMLSHKIRRPVASILGLAQLLDKDNLPNPENIKVIQGVIDAMEELDNIIKEIDDQTTEVKLDPGTDK